MELEINTKEKFDETIKEKRLLVVHFYAQWVDQCQHMFNITKEMIGQKEYEKICFAKIPAEEVPEVSLKYKVSAVPTFVMFQSGKEVGRVEGANPATLSAKLKMLAGMPPSSVPGKASPPPKMDLNTRLKSLINSAPVILFMKGNPGEPKCGFSRQIVEILNSMGVKFKTFDILTDSEVREGLKKYSNWPTYPQLYIEGELIGGLDIVKEMVESGELKDKFPKSGTLNDRLKALTHKSNIMVFMKGNKENPKCGFSRQMMEILNQFGVAFETFDILEDEEVRQGLKTFSNWPTYPQLYVKGELLGGLDIAKELNTAGELQKMLS